MSAGPRKAFLLAAGLGTRLKPLTDKTPKCLLPVKGKPMLEHWLLLCESLGVNEVLINTHHLAAQVEAFVKARKGAAKIMLFDEPKLLGSAGTLAANRAFLGSDPCAWVFYADTLVQADLRPVWALHQKLKPEATLGLFRAPDPKACGVVELDKEGGVLSFVEKPEQPRSDLASGGVFILAAPLWDKIPEKGDLARDVLQNTHSLAGVLMPGSVLDIGTAEAYERANKP